MKSILFSSVFILLLANTQAQIIVGGDAPKKVNEPTKEKKEKSTKEYTPSGVRAFFSTTVASTYRVLVPNKNELFAEPIGERANEVAQTKWSYHVGFSSDIGKHFMWEGGVSLLRNGESYSYKFSDSTHNYTSNYNWIGVPLKLYFKHDFDKFRIQIGAGLIPQMQLKFRRTDNFITTQGLRLEEKFESTTINQSFGLSGVINAGVHYALAPRFGIFAQFEYRYQMTNSYFVRHPYDHRATSIGCNFGFTIGLD